MPRNFEEWLSLALWLAGAGHFCLLIASFQVPFRLGWKEDLAKLTPFNRKLTWVHGGFTVYTIMAFGAMSLALHEEMLRGDRSALALTFFIGFYWLLRIVVDFAYYSHRDWPEGAAFGRNEVRRLVAVGWARGPGGVCGRGTCRRCDQAQS
ncbi:MAG: hypothetical protein DMG36_09010 [Acidobacteria bacterium]|nr:MAG: hypothetical protein DMG36_09010 [Acidobacteriota bacterium]